MAAARQLRSTQTAAEALLWEQLRNRRLAGVRFKRQVPIGCFILDFYCPRYSLGIEVDGPYHDTDTQKDRDDARSQALSTLGIHVLRLSNHTVLNQLDTALCQIQAAIQPPVPNPASLPDPSPHPP